MARLLDHQAGGERRARELLQRIAEAAAVATSVEQAFLTALAEVCHSTGWPVGHVQMRSGEDAAPRSTDLWHPADDERFRALREVTAALPLGSGKGLPGRVLASGEPVLVLDVSRDENFPRAHTARDIGVRAAFAFPVRVGREVHAVLEFFSPEAIEP